MDCALRARSAQTIFPSLCLCASVVKLLLPFLLLLTLAACGERPPPVVPVAPPSGVSITPVSFADLPGWSTDNHSLALAAFRRSCEAIAKLPADRSLANAGRAGDWRGVCQEAQRLANANDAAARMFFETRFVAHRVSDGGSDVGLFTGYYESEIRAARRPGGAYRYPLYARPPDLDGSKPFFTRAEIDGGALTGRGLELLWADDPVDVFFLQVQGSGLALLPDGTRQQIGFAAHNNRPYTAIGRVLAESGAMTAQQVTLQTLRAWLSAHPKEAPALMHRNERYVFFRLLNGDGPIGAEGVALLPGRSLAVDPAFVPYGAPLWLDITDPRDHRTPLRRLVVAQDTGGAIKGAVRGDYFWGVGADALAQAGAMQERGRYFLLLPRGIAARPTS
jgi:membrane-bound lytic murein transglycosylase A